MIKVGIVGGTGYTGVELLRLLAPRQDVRLEVITSRELQGTPVSDLFPNLRGFVDLPFSSPDTEALFACDVVFYATPHAVAMKTVPALLKRGVRVIDLSADFRLKDRALWEKWYKVTHESPEYLAEAVYGLPEINRAKIAGAQLLAVPGCYPTSIQLGFLPLLEAGMVDTAYLIADAKSGVSGAGRKASVGSLLTEASESLSAYGVSGHRHLPEICQGLDSYAGEQVKLTFIPHLTPMIRGIHSTLYAPLREGKDPAVIQQLFENRYANEPFVDVLPQGQYPATRNVRGANRCQIGVCYLPANNMVVVLSVIDNLVKGASGQAVQNMNIMFGLDEEEGLRNVALLP
ncbi:MAG: N-acetyl-gamma-glutamyl-phosphate reductase [Gammaproteobacteria bacterium]|nr:N-acetyl-gamma-glutamyl-phosphate reductase [Pseudomonadales bacterium]MCP5331704.1 N-acetyl-gamma-glutamyl-phosphate reductase [Pseudomonadales bacterium]